MEKLKLVKVNEKNAGKAVRGYRKAEEETVTEDKKRLAAEQNGRMKKLLQKVSQTERRKEGLAS